MFRQKTDKQKISKVIGYEFKTDKLLIQALTRTSGIVEAKQKSGVGDFQRLEFVGDKILGLVIADLLYDCHPTWKEGELTKKTSELVRNRGPLTIIAQKFSLGEYLIMGRGEEMNHSRSNDKVLSDAMEALLGALWLDTGRDYTFMRHFIQEHWSPLGLLPTATYEKLIHLLHDGDISEPEKIRQLGLYLQQDLPPSILNPFLLELVDYTNDTVLIKVILDKGVNSSTLEQALTHCILSHSPQLVQLLLRYKANPNVVISHSEDSHLPYTLSALQTVLTEFPKNKQRLAVIKSLLHYRADPNWRNQVIRRKVSAKARMRDDIEFAVEPLRETLSDLSPIFGEDGGGESYSAFMRKQARRVKEPLEDYKPLTTALHYACIEGTTEEITTLLEAKADPRLQDAGGDSALHAVMSREEGFEEKSDHPSIVRALLDKKASPNTQNKVGDTPLHLMIGKHFRWSNTVKSLEVIETLVEAKADVTLTNQKGNTILHEIMVCMQIGLEVCLKVWGQGLRRMKPSPRSSEKEKKESVVKSSTKTEDRGMDTTSWLQNRLYMDAIMRSATQDSLHRQCILAVDTLPAEETMACMQVKNKQGVAPLSFFNTIKIPADWLQSEPEPASSQKEVVKSSTQEWNTSVL